MAIQIGSIRITGTISGISFYKLYGEHYARKKSSLSSQRVRTSPAFRNTMRYAGWLAEASIIGSEVYHSVRNGKRDRQLYQNITGMIIRLLKKGMKREEIIEMFKKEKSLTNH